MTKTPEQFVIFTDGGSRSNPGHAAIGFVIKDAAGKVLEKCGKYIGIQTNNVAEYQAMAAALETLRILVGERAKEVLVVCYLDSLLVVKQLNGEFRLKAAHLLGLNERIKTLETGFARVSYNYIPRSQNKEADWLVNQALDERT